MRYLCQSCSKEWDYPIDNCIFCGKKISRMNVSKYTVEDIVQVFVPSTDYPITPYYVLLLSDGNGFYKFQKTFQNYRIGQLFNSGENLREKFTIGVIGSGVTGKGIIEIALKAGLRVIFKSRRDANIRSALETISRNLSKSLPPEERDRILNNVTPTTSYELFGNADFVIESVIENFQIKKEIFQKLDSICEPDSILASNTSSLSISKLADGLTYPERVVGLHFFNPIPRMQLLELAITQHTSNNVIEKCRDLANILNKVPIEVKDEPGFIVNRLLFIMISEACNLLEAGTGKIEDIDRAMKLGANHSMGPFELADLIGLDLCLEIIENLNHSSDKNKLIAIKILKEYLERGNLGRKTNKGFYNY